MRSLYVPVLLAFAMLAAPGAAAPKTIATVTLTSHRYTPSPIYLAGGVPVRLILTNRAGRSHEFNAPTFFRSARLLRGRVRQGEIHLAAGRSTVVDLIPARGTYKVHCGQFGHRMLGMSTMIIVL